MDYKGPAWVHTFRTIEYFFLFSYTFVVFLWFSL